MRRQSKAKPTSKLCFHAKAKPIWRDDARGEVLRWNPIRCHHVGLNPDQTISDLVLLSTSDCGCETHARSCRCTVHNGHCWWSCHNLLHSLRMCPPWYHTLKLSHARSLVPVSPMLKQVVCVYVVFVSCVFTLCFYVVLFTLCVYVVSLRCVFTLCVYVVFFTLCVYVVFSRCAFTLCFHAVFHVVFLRCVCTLCLYVVCLRCVVTLCCNVVF